jgi:hypothetical protein
VTLHHDRTRLLCADHHAFHRALHVDETCPVRAGRRMPGFATPQVAVRKIMTARPVLIGKRCLSFASASSRSWISSIQPRLARRYPIVHGDQNPPSRVEYEGMRAFLDRCICAGMVI